jgi:hypothetical protein
MSLQRFIGYYQVRQFERFVLERTGVGGSGVSVNSRAASSRCRSMAGGHCQRLAFVDIHGRVGRDQA